MSSESLDSTRKLPLNDLATEWEAEKVIRDHLKGDNAVLFPENVSESVKAAAEPYIHTLLVPLLTRMSCIPGSPQPAVDPLREQLSLLYHNCSKAKGADDEDVVRDSWMVRKFLGLVKMKCRVGKPSNVIWMQSETKHCTYTDFSSSCFISPLLQMVSKLSTKPSAWNMCACSLCLLHKATK